MVGSNAGGITTAVAQSHLRNVVSFLGMKITAPLELYYFFQKTH